MFYIKLENDESLVVTVKEPIFRGENLNQKIIYLIPPMIDDIDVTSSRVYLNYVRADGVPNVVKLEAMMSKYNEKYYQYTFPINCAMTNVAGNVCTWLHFIPVSSEQIVAKTGECILTIQDSKNIGDCDNDNIFLPDLQDRITFIEDDIERLKKNAHNHDNMDELTRISDGDVDKWNNIVVNMPEDGKDGKDGVTPVLKIDPASSCWMVSYDNGKTWVSTEVNAVGDDYVLTEADKHDIAEQAAHILDENLVASIGTGVLK